MLIEFLLLNKINIFLMDTHLFKMYLLLKNEDHTMSAKNAMLWMGL
jgi:hypothetical protein